MTKAIDPEELTDFIGDAISDSMDMDWTATIGAKAVVRAFEDQRWSVLPAEQVATLIAQLKVAKGHLEHMAAFIGKANRGEFSGCYQLESLGEDMPAINAAIGGAA